MEWNGVKHWDDVLKLKPESLQGMCAATDIHQNCSKPITQYELICRLEWITKGVFFYKANNS